MVVASWLVTVVAWESSSTACELCGQATPTLAELIAPADAVLQVSWISSEKPKRDGDLGRTTFEAVRVVRDAGKSLRVGSRITVDGTHAGKKDDLFLLTGREGEPIEWDIPLRVSEASFKYIIEAPPLDAPPAERLSYFLKHFEAADVTVANDAFAEFVRAPFEDIVLVRDQLPRDNLRRWVIATSSSGNRRGLYGLLLGLCGDASDAKLLESIVIQPTTQTRAGIEGIMGGYLLLAGEAGLKTVEQTKFGDQTLPDSEAYSAVQAVRFLWGNGNGKVSRDRLKLSLRLLLDQPKFTELIIADLARWKDWSTTPRLMEMYVGGKADHEATNRAIVRFLLAAIDDCGSANSRQANAGAEPPHVTEAKRCLAMLREKDPATVAQVERFFQPARIGVKSR
jgi:hypothetical protein